MTGVFGLLRLLPIRDRDKDVEILVLRHQITILQRQLGTARPRFSPADRAFLAALLHRLPRSLLDRIRLLVRPDTGLRWDRDQLARHHAARSRLGRPSRPHTVRSIRLLVLRLARENLIYFNEVDRGNHFAAWQEPTLLPPMSAPRSGHCASGAPRSFTAQLTARSGCCHSPRMGLGERVRYQTSFADSARWEGFVFRPGDIVISTPAKCGTTWLQMICALEIFKSAAFDRPLDQISPWLDALLRPLTGVLADLEAQAHRRFIKTHTPLDGLPFDDRVTYLCASRDPRDVAVSLDSHASNTDRAVSLALREDAVGAVVLDELLAAAPSLPSGTAGERFWSWVNPAAPGKSVSDLEIMLHHLDTFWQVRDQPNIVLLRYEDLLDDLEGQMRYMAARLGIAITEKAWPDLVQAATFAVMKGRADKLAPEASHDGFYHDPSQFFHSGSTGQWRQVLSEEELPRYAARVAECAPADLAAWIHRPALPAAGNP